MSEFLGRLTKERYCAIGSVKLICFGRNKTQILKNTCGNMEAQQYL